MLLQVLLRALAESSSHVAHEGSALQGKSPGPACSSTLETAMVSAGPGAVFPIKGQGMLESPRASPAPSSMVPWLQEARLTHYRVQLSNASLVTCSLALRACHSTCSPRKPQP